jgi:antitoxin component HigA of HigAB toxin-antitoxin module
MAAREMSIADLGRLLGSSGLASDICAGKRGLSKSHIAKLSAHFHVSSSVFLDG